MNKWSRAAVYALPAVVFLGVCLHFSFYYMISWDPNPAIIYGYEATYRLSTILSGFIPWFFWTALGFVIVSMGIGVYLGSHHMITKEPNVESLVYFFGSALLVDILMNAAFYYLIEYVIPPLPGLTSFSWPAIMEGFFMETCLLPLLCFLLAGIGAGLYIGSNVDRQT